MSRVPLAAALAQQDVDLIVGLLLRKALLAEEVDDVLVGAYGVFLVEGEGVVVSDRSVINDLIQLGA